MSDTLMLGADWVPIRVIDWKRAIILILEERAEVIHESDRVIHSPSMEMRVPSVLRLKKMVKIPLSAQVPLTRRSLMLRDNNKCQYCSGTAQSVDHVRPRSRGGKSSWMNLVAACKKCNAYKRDRLLSEIPDMKLLREPFIPTRKFWFVAGIKDKAWEPYLNGIQLIPA